MALFFIHLSQILDKPILNSMENNGITDNNFYEILGISHEADDNEIANAYEAKLSACDELANELDSNGLAPEDIKELRGVLIRAFKTLVDPVKRTQYDSKIFGHAQDNTNINIAPKEEAPPAPNFVIKDSPNSKKEARHSQRKGSGINTQRSRSFQEFPGIPNLVAPAVKSDRPTPVARLNDTATISPAEVNEINEHSASDNTQNIRPQPDVKNETLAKPVQKASAQSYKPVSGQYDATKIRTEAINMRSRKISGDLPRAAVNDIRNASQLEPRSKMEIILIFCAFVLPMVSLIFAIIYLLTS